MSRMPFGRVARVTGPRLTLVVGVRLGGMNRSVRPAHGSASSLVTDGGAAVLPAGGSVVGAVVGGTALAGAWASAAVTVQVHNSAARIWCARIISCLPWAPPAWPAGASPC